MIFLIFCYYILYFIVINYNVYYEGYDIMNFLPLKKGTTSALASKDAFLKLIMRNFVDTALTTEDDGRGIADS